MTITKKDIDYLFDDLWPLMPFAFGADGHKQNCLDKLERLQTCFQKYQNDHDLLLKTLMKFEGIKVVIGTGLIWSVYRETRVPFDKYTMGYALEKNILRLENVSSNYVKYSEKIKEYCDNKSLSDGIEYSIEKFVRDAQYTNFVVEPK